MNFLETIWQRLERAAHQLVLQEVRGQNLVSVTGSELLASVRLARAFLARTGLRKGDRCALLANNGIRWVALDLAMTAEGIIVVPLYARQAPRELAAIVKDCSPSAIFCGDAGLRDAVAVEPAGAARVCLFDEIFASGSASGGVQQGPRPLVGSDPVAIIYTSGTSGEPKGAVLTAANVTYMLGCTNARLDLLMGKRDEPERVFHYLPFSFASSWIVLLTCLSRNSLLSLSTDLAKLADEMKLAAPHYCVNVPTLLERIRVRIDEQFAKRGRLAHRLYQNAKAAWFRRRGGTPRGLDGVWLAVGNAWLFPAIRKRLGPNLRALICGSAPLALETQQFFFMLGVPVLQVYGLTETTAICTMDHPQQVEPGYVGSAIPGIEMRLAEDNNEILVRGPNIFAGYWDRAEETAKVLRGGWFHTGDQGEVNGSGNWRIIGRLKNLIILNSGHNVAPEPIEDSLLRVLPEAQQVVLQGNNRSYLTAMITGTVTPQQAQTALEAVNSQLPHYKQIRAFSVLSEPFSVENSLLTANGKPRRDAIAARFREQIDEMYCKLRE